jgi:hypothetical protein
MVRQAVRQAHGPEQSRRLTTLSQPVENLKVERVEGQIPITEIQNSKPVLVIGYWCLRFEIYLFPNYSALGPCPTIQNRFQLL